MCEWGNTAPLRVLVPADLSWTGQARWDTKDIDRCLLPLVQALNDSGLPTRASCCGHGHRPGNVVLADGRWLIVASEEQAQQIEALWPLDIHGERIDGRADA